MRSLLFNRRWLFWLFAAAVFHGTADAAPQVKPLTDAQVKEYKLERAFYKKGTLVQDILIATSDQVSDFAHLETAYLFDMMMKSIKPEIAQRIREQKVLCVLVGHKEFTSDVPQFKTNKTGKELDFYNWRQRARTSWTRTAMTFSLPQRITFALTR